MGDDNILTVALKMGFLGGSDDKESASNVGDLGLIPGLGRSPTRAWQPTPVFLPGESHAWTEELGGLWSIGLWSQTQLKQQNTHAQTKIFREEKILFLVLSFGCSALP